MIFLLVLLMQVNAQEGPAQKITEPVTAAKTGCKGLQCSFTINAVKHFGIFSGCLYYKNITTGETNRYGDCAKAYKPCSTYKILNSLIGLETGVLKDQNTTIPWDGKKQWNKDWEKDLNLKEAIELSAVPYFQEVARRIGKRRMEHYVKLANYGNKNIGTVIDRFWLDGPLAINAFEQASFYEKLLKNQLPFKKDHQALVKELLVLERTNEYVLSGKTGTDMQDNKTVLGWFVGNIRKNNEDIVFAINIQGKDEAWGRVAKDIAKKILL